jgi:hypothetical protein
MLINNNVKRMAASTSSTRSSNIVTLVMANPGSSAWIALRMGVTTDPSSPKPRPQGPEQE